LQVAVVADVVDDCRLKHACEVANK
jgi:hypothetical protein